MPRSRLLLCLLLLSPGAAGAFAQGQPAADPAASRARCAQLVEFWDRYAGNKGEGGGSKL